MFAPYFDGDQAQDHFYSEDTSIYIISKEQIIYISWISCLLQHVDQIIELAMQVSHYHNWFAYLYQVWLFT
jgi:hypothetical protein